MSKKDLRSQLVALDKNKVFASVVTEETSDAVIQGFIDMLTNAAKTEAALTEANQALAEAEQNAGKPTQITGKGSNKNNYVINHAIRTKEGVISKEDIANNAKLISELASKNSTAVSLID